MDKSLNDLACEIVRTPVRLSLRDLNGLVKDSFGITFRGDLMKDYDLTGFTLFRGKALGIIGRKFPFIDKVVGRFTSPDGSSLSVTPKYEAYAKRYVESFTELTGREADYTIEEVIL